LPDVAVQFSVENLPDLARPAASPIARPLVAGIPNVPKIWQKMKKMAAVAYYLNEGLDKAL
jgi:hypothetical protein